MHNNPLVTSINGALITPTEKNITVNGGAEKELGMSYHVNNLPYDSHTPDSLQTSSLNTASHSGLSMQHNNASHPTTSGSYMPQPDPYINRDLPEKDTGSRQAPHTTLEDTVKIERLPSSLGDQEITKSLAMLNINDKTRDMFSPRKYDDNMQNDNEAKLYSNGGAPSLKLDIPLSGDSTRRESGENRKTRSPEKPTLNNTLVANGKTYPIEADHNKAEPSTLTTMDDTADAKQGNDSKFQRPLPANENSPSELKTSESTTKSTTDISLKDNGVASLTHPIEEKAQKKNMSPDSLSSSSRETASLSPMKAVSINRPTSALPSKVPTPGAEDSDTDFFDQNVNVKGG